MVPFSKSSHPAGNSKGHLLELISASSGGNGPAKGGWMALGLTPFELIGRSTGSELLGCTCRTAGSQEAINDLICPEKTPGTLGISLLSANWLLLGEFIARGVHLFTFRSFWLRVQGLVRPKLQDGGLI